MGQEDEILPETLAKDVPVSVTLSGGTDGDGVDGVKVSDVSVEGFDINTPLDEDGITQTAVAGSEIKVDTTMRLGTCEPDFGLVEPASDAGSGGMDAETGLDFGLVEPESGGVPVGADVVHESRVSASEEVETGLGIGSVEPKSNGVSVDADVHESVVRIPKDGETGLKFGLVESNGDSADTDGCGSHVSVLKEVDSGKDIDLVEPNSNGDSAGADVLESHMSTIKDVETGPDFGIVEPKRDGVSVGVDAHESLIGASKNVVTGSDFGLVEPESNGVPVSTDSPKGVEIDSGEVNASVTDTVTKRDVISPRKEELHGDSDVEMDGETDGNDTDDNVEEHDYSVGDMVWGKVKSHPWWPGQIYDSSDASSDAMKYRSSGRLLVAYYGDGTFAWCLPSQLMPFAENFENMSKQRGPKNYLNAVTEAVDEIGRLVDIALTCDCVPEDGRKGLASPSVVNAGIRPGVIAPEGDIGKLLSFRYNPSEILATVAVTARTVSFANKLELSILKGWLSAFYRTKGGFPLARYHVPVLVEGLEDKSETDDTGAADVSTPLQGPVEEESGSFSTLLGNVVNMRKQKSVAELIASGNDTTPGSRKSGGKKAINSGNKKRKANEEDGGCSDVIQDCPTRKKRVRKPKDKMSPENGVSSEEKLQESAKPTESLEVAIPGEHDEGGDTQRLEEKLSPRERKKSKYLSLPYTSPPSRVGYRRHKDEWESEIFTQVAKVGERMTKAAVQLLDSTPMNCNVESEKKEEEVPIVYSREKAVKSAEQKDEYSNNMHTIDVVNAGVGEVLSGLKSMAASPWKSVSADILDLTRAFISAFISSKYWTGESYEFNNLVDNSIQAEMESPAEDQPKSKKRKRKNPEIDEKKLDAPKPKRRVARCSSKKGNLEDDENSKVPEASSLVLTFDSVFSVPAKDEIMEKFSKFGDINEGESDVVPDSATVKIVYLEGGCVEKALKVSIYDEPLFSGIIDYKLCYTQIGTI